MRYRYNSFATYIKEPQRPVDTFLIIIAPSEPKDNLTDSPFTWVLHGGSTYKTPYPLYANESWPIWAIYHNGIEVTPKLSIAEVEATPFSWFSDIEAQRFAFIQMLDSSDPNGQDIQIAPLIALCTDIPKDLNEVQFTIPITFRNIKAEQILFRRIVAREGLGDISYKSESAYYGFTIPDLGSLKLANLKTNMRSTSLNGEFDTWKDRFEFRDRDCVVLGGDAGVVLTFEQHKNFGTFRMVNADLVTRQSLTISLSSGLSLHKKLIPTEFYENIENEDFEAEMRGKFKPLLWGTNIRVPTYQISETEFSFLGQVQDSVSAVWKVGDGIQTLAGEDAYEVGEGVIIFHSAPLAAGEEEENPYKWIEVVTTKAVDSDGNPAAIQLAGAFMRQFKHTICETPLSQLPKAAYDAYDAAYPTEVIVYVHGDTQVEAQTVIDTWQKCLLAVLQFKNNEWIPKQFDPDDLTDIAATVFQDEITTHIERLSDPKEINGVVTFSYNYRPNDKAYKQVTKRLNSAVSRFKLAEQPFLVEPSYIKNKADAEEKAVLYLCLVGRERDLYKFSATGEVIDTCQGDLIQVNSDIAPSATGAWANQKLKIKDIDLHTTRRPEGVANLILEEVITPEIRDAVLANLDFPPPESGTIQLLDGSTLDSGEDTNILVIPKNHNGDCLLVKIFYNMTSANPNISPTSVKWNADTEDLTNIKTTTTSAGIRTSIWASLTATTGEHSIKVLMPANVDTICAVVQSYNNVGSISATTLAVYQVSGKTIQGEIACAVGDLIVDAYICQRAPTIAQQHLGERQELDFSLRVPYDGNYQSENAHRAIGSHKVAQSIGVLMKHTEDLNNQPKALAVIILKP